MTDAPGDGGGAEVLDPWDDNQSPPDGTGDVLPQIRNIWAWWGWTMVVVVIVVTGVAILGDILRASVLLDVVSFWPVFLLIAVGAAVWTAKRKSWPARLGSAISLMALTALLGVVALHLLGWSALPSSVVLEGPPFEGGEVSLEIVVRDGLVLVDTAERESAFAVSLIPRGGSIAAPRATGLDSEPLDVSLVERGDPGLHRSEGWVVELAESGRWAVVLEALEIDADLRDTVIESSVFDGAGSVLLDGVAPGSTIELRGGPFAIEVPLGVGVGVEGDASVPPDWTVTESGMASPSGRGGFVIVVAPEAQVEIGHP